MSVHPVDVVIRVIQSYTDLILDICSRADAILDIQSYADLRNT